MRLGRYETLQPIASGGMAVVHLARALGAGGFERLVAIKAMHNHIASEPEFVAMFLDEARLAARIRHPNVVATIDVQEDPLFLVMEYIEGPSLYLVLRDLRRREKRVEQGVALRVILDTLAGLHAAHEQIGSDGVPLEIVHRDVTPHNVLMGVDGISRITDFGVARAASRLSSTRGGQVKGKLAYMAPEQFMGTPVDRRVDIYAASAVLYEILTGRPLFAGDTEAALMGAIIRGVTTPLWQIDRRVSREVSDVCMRALDVKRSNRFQTAAEFAEALEDAAQRSGVAIATPRAVSQVVKTLAVHEPPPSITQPTGLRDIPPPSPSGSGQRPTAPSPPPSQDPPTSASQSTSLGSLASPAAVAPPPARRTWKVVMGVAAVMGLAIGLGLYFVTKKDDAVSLSNASTAVPAASGSAAPAGSADSAATVTPVASTSAASSASASAPAGASASSSASAPVVPGRAPTTGGGRPPGTSPTSFRPDGL